MVQYITKRELDIYLKAMTILDILMVSEEEAWLRLTSFHKQANAYTYVLDNGSGDELMAMFTEKGVLIKGFDHENELNQYAADELDNKFIEHTYNELPEEFFELLDKDDRDNTTFCMWCIDDTDMWMQNEIEGNDGGKDFLLSYICKNSKEWSNWAKDYYDAEIARNVVDKVYSDEELTEEDVAKLNPERDAKEVFAEIECLKFVV